MVPDESMSLADGAIAPWARGDRKLVREALQSLNRNFGIDLTSPFGKLPRKARELMLFGGGRPSESLTGKAPRTVIVLNEWRTGERSAVWVSHNVDQAPRVASRMVFIDKGRVLAGSKIGVAIP